MSDHIEHELIPRAAVLAAVERLAHAGCAAPSALDTVPVLVADLGLVNGFALGVLMDMRERVEKHRALMELIAVTVEANAKLREQIDALTSDKIRVCLLLGQMAHAVGLEDGCAIESLVAEVARLKTALNEAYAKDAADRGLA